jgi:hypothetical protein
MNTDNLTTPLTRLLDLTAGWAQFVQENEEDAVDAAVSADELCELYQEAGRLMAEDLSPREEARRVRRFVEERILPLLLRETPAAEGTATSAEKAAA